MKWGPRPSRALVEAGASTQLRLKKELPMTKRVRSSSVRFAAGKEKALRPVAKTVVSPPVFSPRGSVAGAAWTGKARTPRRRAEQRRFMAVMS